MQVRKHACVHVCARLGKSTLRRGGEPIVLQGGSYFDPKTRPQNLPTKSGEHPLTTPAVLHMPKTVCAPAIGSGSIDATPQLGLRPQNERCPKIAPRVVARQAPSNHACNFAHARTHTGAHTLLHGETCKSNPRTSDVHQSGKGHLTKACECMNTRAHGTLRAHVNVCTHTHNGHVHTHK